MYTLYRHIQYPHMYHARSEKYGTCYSNLEMVIDFIKRSKLAPDSLNLNLNYWKPVATFTSTNINLSDYPELQL